MRWVAADKIDGHDVYLVTGTAKNGSGVDRLYFDAQSGLLLRATTNMNSVLGSFPEITTFEDYRDVSGVKVAYTVRESSPEGDKVYKFDSVQINAPVEDARFQQPPPKPPARRPIRVSKTFDSGRSRLHTGVRSVETRILVAYSAVKEAK